VEAYWVVRCRGSHSLGSRLTDGGKSVGLTRRPPLYSPETYCHALREVRVNYETWTEDWLLDLFVLRLQPPQITITWNLYVAPAAPWIRFSFWWSPSASSLLFGLSLNCCPTSFCSVWSLCSAGCHSTAVRPPSALRGVTQPLSDLLLLCLISLLWGLSLNRCPTSFCSVWSLCSAGCHSTAVRSPSALSNLSALRAVTQPLSELLLLCPISLLCGVSLNCCPISFSSVWSLCSAGCHSTAVRPTSALSVDLKV
jgi:hypothetical protein